MLLLLTFDFTCHANSLGNNNGEQQQQKYNSMLETDLPEVTEDPNAGEF